MTYSQQYLSLLNKTLETLDHARIEQALAWFREARDAGRTVFVCGNGGSAASASHFVTDVLKGASYNRTKRFRIIALTDSLPTVSAYANDVSYDCVFVEQLKNFAQPQDLVMGISGSGNSPNVVKTIEYANSIGCRTIGLTGRNGGKLGPISQLNIHVPDPHMGRIEDAHMIVCHVIAYHFMEEKE